MQYKKIILLTLFLILAIYIFSPISSNEMEYYAPEEHVIKISNSISSFVPSKYSADTEHFRAVKKQEQVACIEENVTPSKTEVVSRGASRYSISKKDFEILSRISASETADGTLEQKMNAVQVVLNRVNDSRFPGTIEQVVFAETQFSVVADGSYYRREVREIDLVAVQNVLANPTIHNAVFFQAEWCDSRWFGTLHFLFSDGIHKFYVTD